MSSQRGNVSRSRQQKHKNTTAYKNDLHNKTQKMASINKTELSGLCQRCKEVIQWRIKYGKYKPLTIPRKCNKCQEKCVKKAYHTLCFPCASDVGVCCKCGEKEEIVEQPGLSAAEQASQDSKLEQEIKYLTERQRRSFFRLQEKGELSGKLLEGGISDKVSECDNSDDSSDSEDDLDIGTLQPKSTRSDSDLQEGSGQTELCKKTETDLTLET